MKRDMELVIKILEHLEAREARSVITELDIPDYDREVVAYHLCRMYEGGFLDAEAVTSSTNESRIIKVLPFGLTWQGHEFLDAMRNKGVAEKVREKLGGSLMQVPAILIKELAIAIGRQQLGL